MQTPTLTSLLLIAGLCHAQQVAGYVQLEGNRSSPRDVAPEVRNVLEQADSSPDASHTVSFRSPGNGDWDWTLQISDVSAPSISNSTPDAHVAFTTWHFSRTGKERMMSKRAEDSPVCAYLLDINFPYNVSSQWDPDDSSCASALGLNCSSALGAVRITDSCDASNALLSPLAEDACAGMLHGGPGETAGVGTQGYAFNARNVTDGAWGYALTSPYEAGDETAFQAASEQLRIMVFSGSEGNEVVCNRVAQTAEIGAGEDDDNEQGSGSGGGSEAGGDESGASSCSSHVGVLAVGVVVSCLAAYWL